METLPHDVLLEVFKLIDFSELHGSIRLVCRRWYRLIVDHCAHPRAITITESMEVEEVEKLVEKFSTRITKLEICNMADSGIIKILQLSNWTNLRTLSVRAKWTNCEGPCLVSVDALNQIINQSPKLRSIILRECHIRGNLQLLIENLEKRQIHRMSILNKYVFTDNLEKFYNLRNMQVHRVFCHCFKTNILLCKIKEFSFNNKRTLEDLSLILPFTENKKLINSNDFVIRELTVCNELVKLNIAGYFNLSFTGLEAITKLPKLRCLKLEISATPSHDFARFLTLQFAQKLNELQIFWNRAVSPEEMKCLLVFSNLFQLSIGFYGPIYSDIVSDIGLLINRRGKLNVLKVRSTHLHFLTMLHRLKVEFFQVSSLKLKLFYNITVISTLRKNILNELDLISSYFNYKYVLRETGFEITVTRKLV